MTCTKCFPTIYFLSYLCSKSMKRTHKTTCFFWADIFLAQGNFTSRIIFHFSNHGSKLKTWLIIIYCSEKLSKRKFLLSLNFPNFYKLSSRTEDVILAHICFTAKNWLKFVLDKQKITRVWLVLLTKQKLCSWESGESIQFSYNEILSFSHCQTTLMGKQIFKIEYNIDSLIS
jgi:hypothetical protein